MLVKYITLKSNNVTKKKNQETVIRNAPNDSGRLLLVG